MEIAVPFGVIERTVCANRGRLDPGKIFDAFEQLSPKSVFLFVLFVLRVGQRDWEGYNAVGIESERGIFRVPEALQRQTGTGEQNNCERNLSNDEPGPDSSPTGAIA